MNGEENEASTSDAIETANIDRENSCSWSGFNAASESDWKPINSSVKIVQQMLNESVCPREILNRLLPDAELPPDLSDTMILHIITQILSETPRREKMPQFNNLEDAVQLLKDSQNIIILSGAGMSVSCGIPDFRSKDGIYARLSKDFPDLPNPQAMFDIHYFRRNPRPFFDFAQEIYPGQFKPSLSHYFVRKLEDTGKLLRNYTQNIDTLEQVSGITKIMQCHGSFAKATCLVCKQQVSCEEIRESIFRKELPRCGRCPPEIVGAILKPNIIFFGEDLPSEFHEQITEDKDKVDLLIVVGSSLKVRPVALIPSSIPADIPQILINRNPLPHCNMDIQLLGNCDDVINELCLRLGGEFHSVCRENTSILQKITELTVQNENTQDQSEQPFVVNSSSATLEPEEKRSRIDSPLWSPRYLNVSDHLPVSSYLFIPPNQCVFNGAELYYDRDSKTFTSQIGDHHASGSDSTESIDGSSVSSDSGKCRTWPESDEIADQVDPERSQSCPVFLHECDLSRRE